MYLSLSHGHCLASQVHNKHKLWVGEAVSQGIGADGHRIKPPSLKLAPDSWQLLDLLSFGFLIWKNGLTNQKVL